MPWTDNTRSHYVRRHCRYASDLSDAEWRLIEPFESGGAKFDHGSDRIVRPRAE